MNELVDELKKNAQLSFEKSYAISSKENFKQGK